MKLFPSRNRPRTCLDLKVGKSHLVEVVLHLRRADWDWYNSKDDEIAEDLMDLMERSVIPRMFGDDIEEYHKKHNPDWFLSDEKNAVGSKNVKSRKNQVNAGKNNKGRKGSKLAKSQLPPEAEEKKPEKDVYFAFGEIIQLAYRKQPLQSDSGRTIFFKPQGDGFYDLPKLPARLLIWISKIDPQNKTQPDPANVGFYRPEMIPITSLFREPKEEAGGKR